MERFAVTAFVVVKQLGGREACKCFVGPQRAVVG